MKRDWNHAQAKCNEGGRRCRVCYTDSRVEAAHIIGREYDQPDGRPDLLYVKPDRIVPLCGPATDTTTCHGKQHAKTLDLLPYLTREEETQAVADVGIERAHRLLAPSVYRVAV